MDSHDFSNGADAYFDSDIQVQEVENNRQVVKYLIYFSKPRSRGFFQQPDYDDDRNFGQGAPPPLPELPLPCRRRPPSSNVSSASVDLSGALGSQVPPPPPSAKSHKTPAVPKKVQSNNSSSSRNAEEAKG